MAVKVKVKISHVYCGNTEDVSGPDELYFISALSDGSPEHTQAAIIGPMSINDDQHRYPEQIVFDATVKEGAQIRGGFIAFDEDMSKDWSNKPEWIEKLKNGVVKGLQVSGDPYAATAGTIIKIGYDVLDFFFSHDKDDELGRREVDFTANGQESRKIPWRFSEDDLTGYSSWNYVVDYEISQERQIEIVVPPQPTLSPAWEVNANGFHGSLTTSVDGSGIVSGTIFGDKITGLWDEDAKKITFVRALSKESENLPKFINLIEGYQVYTGYWFRDEQPPNPVSVAYRDILVGSFEAFVGEGTMANRNLFGWHAYVDNWIPR